MKYYKFVGSEEERTAYVYEPDRDKVYSEDDKLSNISDYHISYWVRCYPKEWQEVDNPDVIKVGNGDGTYSTAGQFRVGSKTVTTTNSFQSKVSYVLKGIEEMLVAKNKKYGNSALEPSNVFSKLPAKEGLLLRIDDKLKRIANGSYENDDEDVINDLIGYLVLLKIVDNG